MGKLWDIVERWRDGMEFPPSYRQIALKLDVSQSTFDGWRNPVELPEPGNLLAISRLTGTPYRIVVEAAIEDVGLFDLEKAEQNAEVLAQRRAARRRRAKEPGDQ